METVSEDSRSIEFDCRAGGRVLSLFTTPLHCLVVRALASGPMRLTDLRRQVGGPPQTTLRGHLGNLIEIGALEKCAADGRPTMVENALTPMGIDLLQVADTLDVWLARAPEGPLPPQSEAAKAATKALIGGWDSTMLRALAARPFSLTELDNLITGHTYPALERRLSALHFAGLVAAVPSSEKGTPYAVSDWLRLGVAPLIAAVRCETRHLRGQVAPVSRIDIEALMLLSLPLVALANGATTNCQLIVETDEEPRSRAAGATVMFEAGEVVACSSKLDPDPPTSVRGPLPDWLDAIIDGNPGRLMVDGDAETGRQVVGGLRGSLFGA